MFRIRHAVDSKNGMRAMPRSRRTLQERPEEVSTLGYGTRRAAGLVLRLKSSFHVVVNALMVVLHVLVSLTIRSRSQPVKVTVLPVLWPLPGHDGRTTVRLLAKIYTKKSVKARPLNWAVCK